MSGQRAIKFCRLCHKYAQVIPTGLLQEDLKNATPLSVADYSILKNSLEEYATALSLRDYATSQAMQALEDVAHGGTFNKEALDACRDCDYKEPRIAQLLEKGKATS